MEFLSNGEYSAWAKERHRRNLTVYDCRACGKPIGKNQSYRSDAEGIQHIFCSEDRRPPKKVIPYASLIKDRY